MKDTKLIKILEDRLKDGVWTGAYDGDKPIVTISGVPTDAIKAGKTVGVRVKSKSKDIKEDKDADMGKPKSTGDTGDSSRGNSED